MNPVMTLSSSKWGLKRDHFRSKSFWILLLKSLVFLHLIQRVLLRFLFLFILHDQTIFYMYLNLEDDQKSVCLFSADVFCLSIKKKECKYMYKE